MEVRKVVFISFFQKTGLKINCKIGKASIQLSLRSEMNLQLPTEIRDWHLSPELKIDML